jgi:hypothetical protein
MHFTFGINRGEEGLEILTIVTVIFELIENYE